MKKSLFLTLLGMLFLSCNNLETERQTYLEFLYDNMSLPDRIDYDSAFYVRQVQAALQARSEMAWGRSVPEREFRHFVLPPRVNNEDLDDFRTIYYTELASRVKGLTMTEAILEVNHWCHEHVTYRPTSARTLGPASTIRTAYGRCGEESVLLVAALRTVGIPARQVYTPRWAHTDDNHAWVEAWADGQWHFLGACEPEPVLDLGWFNESASRGMLMHTKVFGNYDGPEEIVSQEHNLTEINVTDNYAPTRRLIVTVIDSLEKPVPDAKVEFKLYNYAEFYTVASKQTDADGRAFLTAGLGDMLVWASTSDGLACQQVSFARDSIVTLRLIPTSASSVAQLPSSAAMPASSAAMPASSTAMPVESSPTSATVPAALAAGLSLDITPPAANASLPAVSPEAREENNRRLALEDSIRHSYEQTMTDQRCRGNQEVLDGIRKYGEQIHAEAIVERLVAILPDKDLQDVSLNVLIDNVAPSKQPASQYPLPDDPDLAAYVLSPRIEREMLTAFKEPLREAFHAFSIDQLIQWTNDSITIVEGQNPQHLRMRPLGVYRSRTADQLGRDIFFVAACRALGIPARINEINAKVQYYLDGWRDVAFSSASVPSDSQTAKAEGTAPTGKLRLTYQPTTYLPDAKYYTHFTLSRLHDNNQLQLMTYPEEATFANTFASGVSLDAGTYVLVTGTRMADGGVLASIQAFEVKAGATTTIPLTLRHRDDAVSVIGSLNAEDLYHPLTISPFAVTAPTSLLATCGRGYYALGIIAPNQEPTNHTLRDISLVRNDLDSWGRKMVLLFESEDDARRFNFKEFSNLPSNVAWGIDADGSIMREAIEQLHLTSSSLPIFLICDSFNRVVFVQQGYTIGLGEQLLKVIHQL